MSPEERQALREKHHLYYEEDLVECVACSTPEDSVEWPCDAIKVLDELDRVMNAAEVYGIAVKHLTERNIERSKILAVIHAYDETPESKLARIWEVLRREA